MGLKKPLDNRRGLADFSQNDYRCLVNTFCVG